MSYYLGIDFGTSGARAIAIDSNGTIKAQAQSSFVSATDLAVSWKKTLFQLIEALPKSVRQGIDAIAINGTSSTVLLC
ncbi:MAG: carbohydrate kinase, partial [Chroococcales cyanobacterium]